jgi:hypothetical protein
MNIEHNHEHKTPSEWNGYYRYWNTEAAPVQGTVPLLPPPLYLEVRPIVYTCTARYGRTPAQLRCTNLVHRLQLRIKFEIVTLLVSYVLNLVLSKYFKIYYKGFKLCYWVTAVLNLVLNLVPTTSSTSRYSFYSQVEVPIRLCGDRVNFKILSGDSPNTSLVACRAVRTDCCRDH